MTNPLQNNDKDSSLQNNDKSSYSSDFEETRLAFSTIKQTEKEREEISLKSGMVFGGQYCLVRLAGTGKMGEVWKAYDRIGERDVALKFVPRNIDNYESEIQKAKKCFQDVYALNHQYLCPIHAIVEDKDFGYCLVMKWMPGTLEEYQKETVGPGKSLEFKKTLLVLNHLAEALDYIHEKNVIHRDVKTKNVAVTKNENGDLVAASLIDFGLANSLEVYSHDFTPHSGTISGTPVYMPPEQWVNDAQSPQTDQYALAIIAYKLISGHVPFSNPNVKQLRSLIFNETPKLIPGVPRYVNTALQKALSKKPENRFSNCRQFVYELSGARRKKKILLSLLICLGILLVTFPMIYQQIRPKETVQVAYEEVLPVYKSVLIKDSEKEYAYIFQEIQESTALPNSADDLMERQNKSSADEKAGTSGESKNKSGGLTTPASGTKFPKDQSGSIKLGDAGNKTNSLASTKPLNPLQKVSLASSELASDKKSGSPAKKNSKDNKALSLSQIVKANEGRDNQKALSKKRTAFLMIGSEPLAVFEQREGPGWSYAYDKANSRGVLTLNGYNGASFDVSGIDLAVIVKDGTENRIKADGAHGALYQANGKLEISGSDKGTGKLYLSGENLTLPAEGELSAVLYSGESLSIKNLESVFVTGSGKSFGIAVKNGEFKMEKIHILQVKTEKESDSIHVNGDFSIFGSASDIISLQGALWHNGALSLQPARSDLSSMMRPYDPQTGKVQMKFEILGKTVDHFLWTVEDLSKAFNAPDRELCCALAANIELDYNSKDTATPKSKTEKPDKEVPSEKQEENADYGRSDLKNSQAVDLENGLLVLNRQKSYTFLSTGNWTIKRIPHSKMTHEFLRVYGELVLGTPLGMGSSSLTFDGGGKRSIIPNTPMSGDIVCQSFDGKKYVFRKYEVENTSKCSLIVVHGILKMYHGACIQNNINTNFFRTANDEGLAHEELVGGVFVASSGMFEMHGGKITQCQAPLCGGVCVNGLFQLYDGEICLNTGYNNGSNKVEGGGVAVRMGEIEMSGGRIIGNLALADNTARNGSRAAKGGGIHISQKSKVTISGGEISENLCLWGGGGIYVGGRGTSILNLSGNTKICDNFAILGSGIYANSPINLKGGRITNNKLANGVSASMPRGSGIYLREWGAGDILSEGPTISLSGNIIMDKEDDIFILDNKITRTNTGMFTFAPIVVTGPLTEKNQHFTISLGSAAASEDKTIQLVALQNQEVIDSIDNILDKFQFGFLGYEKNNNFQFEHHISRKNRVNNHFLILKDKK